MKMRWDNGSVEVTLIRGNVADWLKAAAFAVGLAIAITILLISLPLIFTDDSKHGLIKNARFTLFFLPGHLLTAILTVATSKPNQQIRYAVSTFPAFAGFCCATFTGFAMVAMIGHDAAGFIYSYIGMFVGVIEAPFWMIGGATASVFLRKFTTVPPVPPDRHTDVAPETTPSADKPLSKIIIAALVIGVSAPSIVVTGILLSIYGGSDDVEFQSMFAGIRLAVFCLPGVYTAAVEILKACIRQNLRHGTAARLAALTGFKYAAITGMVLTSIWSFVFGRFDLVLPVFFALIAALAQTPFWAVAGAALSAHIQKTNPSTTNSSNS